MRTTICIFLILIPTVSFGKCLDAPNHTFVISIYQCNSAKFDPGTLRTQTGDYIDMQGESVSGALLSGYVSGNEYHWEGNSNPMDFRGWENDSYQTVFILSDAESICDKEMSFKMKLRTVKRCCDVSPRAGYCFVPWTIPIVTQEN